MYCSTNVFCFSSFSYLFSFFCRNQNLSPYLVLDFWVQELNLAFNHITDSGCESLAKSLKKNKTLKKLWINRNQVTDDGIKEFATVLLNDNLTLEDFWFFPNDEMKDGCDELSVKAIMKMLKVMEDRKKNMKGRRRDD